MATPQPIQVAEGIPLELANPDQQHNDDLDQLLPSTPTLIPWAAQPRRFHGTVTRDPTRVGRDAGRIVEGVIAHLSSLVGAKVMVTLEVEAEIPSGAADHGVRTVTEEQPVAEVQWSGVREVVGTNSQLDVSLPATSGTRHTTRVCHLLGVLMKTQADWMSWGDL
jgi:hypothetical protein